MNEYAVHKYEELKRKSSGKYTYYYPVGNKKVVGTVYAENFKNALRSAREWAKSKNIAIRYIKIRKVYDYMR